MSAARQTLSGAAAAERSPSVQQLELPQVPHSGSSRTCTGAAATAAASRIRAPGDTADPVLVGSLVPGHDAVVNFAAETHVDVRSAARRRLSTATWPGCRCCCRRACTPGPDRWCRCPPTRSTGASRRVVNWAAWTAVDDTEASEEQALAINAGGAARLAAGSAAAGDRLMQAPAGIYLGRRV
jgi:hypothetical protein